MPRPIDQRVGVFIDVQNMFYAAKHLYGSKLNFARLQDYIARDRPLVRSIAYVVQTPEIDQSNFLAMLRSNGYEIRSKDLKQRPDGSAKGDWDMGLALDALAMSEKLDVVAIVSGDGDFVDLVNFLKARGVRVEIYSFPYSTAEELRWAATEYFQMGTEMVINPQQRPQALDKAAEFRGDARERGFDSGLDGRGYPRGDYEERPATRFYDRELLDDVENRVSEKPLHDYSNAREDGVSVVEASVID
jgi:uncharacterized LabA/DUF88 family protein